LGAVAGGRVGPGAAVGGVRRRGRRRAATRGCLPAGGEVGVLDVAEARRVVREAGDARLARDVRPSPAAVGRAMQGLEAEALGGRGGPAPRAAELVGKTWRLAFSTALMSDDWESTKAGYMPISERLRLREDGTADLVTNFVALLPSAQMGGAWSIDEAGSPGVLAFAFDKVGLGGIMVPVSSPKDKTYDVFYLDDRVAACRSSSGALTLLASCDALQDAQGGGTDLDFLGPSLRIAGSVALVSAGLVLAFLLANHAI